MSGLNEVGAGIGKPGGLKKDQLYIQHEPGEGNNKMLALWGGDKSGQQKCIHPLTVVVPGDGNDYEMEANDKLVNADTTSSTVTITLPQPAEIEEGHSIIINDAGGNSTNNNITVATPGSETTEISTISNNGDHVRLLWDAENENWIGLT